MVGGEEGFPILCIPYTYGVDVLGVFNWNDLDEEESDIVRDDFPSQFNNAVSERIAWGRGDSDSAPVFPPSFRVELTEVRFGLSCIDHVLKMSGLGDELDSNLDGAGSGE